MWSEFYLFYPNVLRFSDIEEHAFVNNKAQVLKNDHLKICSDKNNMSA